MKAEEIREVKGCGGVLKTTQPLKQLCSMEKQTYNLLQEFAMSSSFGNVLHAALACAAAKDSITVSC